MNRKPIEQAKNPLLSKALPALERAALQARKIAAQTGTAIIVRQDGVVQRIQPGAVQEPRSDYQAEKDK